MTAPSAGSLAELVAQRPNDHNAWTSRFTAATGVGWHEPTPASVGAGGPVSVVVPARDAGYCLPSVLDALAAQEYHGHREVIVVDDCSTDDTAAIAATHPAVDVVVRLPARRGPAVSRNVGVRLARGDTVVLLDADMVLPPHVLSDVAVRAAARLVLVGFRHDVVWRPGQFGRAVLPAGRPDVWADPRAHRRPSTSPEPVGDREPDPATAVLGVTRDWQGLGHGLTYAGWDLPRVVEARLMAAPRAAIVDVGGFDPAFTSPGLEGALLGAALVGLGLLVVPLRQAVGWHILPPDPHAAWQAYLQAWPQQVRTYEQRLADPPRTGQGAAFARTVDGILAGAAVTARAAAR